MIECQFYINLPYVTALETGLHMSRGSCRSRCGRWSRCSRWSRNEVGVESVESGWSRGGVGVESVKSVESV